MERHCSRFHLSDNFIPLQQSQERKKKKKSFISQKYVIKYTYKSMTLCIYSEPVNSSCAHNSSSLRNQKPKEKKKSQTWNSGVSVNSSLKLTFRLTLKKKINQVYQKAIYQKRLWQVSCDSLCGSKGLRYLSSFCIDITVWPCGTKQMEPQNMRIKINSWCHQANSESQRGEETCWSLHG